MTENVPTGLPKDFDTAAMLEIYPLKMKEHEVRTETPFNLRYRDPVQGKKVIDATIHWVTARGQLFISFPGRNSEYPNVRAGAIVPVPKCRKAKQDFLGSGGKVAVVRQASDFEQYDITDFELFVVGSAPESRSSDRYPETQLLGRFKQENFSSVFLRSTFISVYGIEDTEELLTNQRNCDGSPHPRKARDIIGEMYEPNDSFKVPPSQSRAPYPPSSVPRASPPPPRVSNPSNSQPPSVPNPSKPPSPPRVPNPPNSSQVPQVPKPSNPTPPGVSDHQGAYRQPYFEEDDDDSIL
ncbi:hypothetical protein GGR54DRAFT_615476 [Hypoxylon sp. NC1633]|nr:hypothetical protein GGR54DRAFT_615476 [Hypoxylon sp. NC1633]